MSPILRGQLSNEIESAEVKFDDTGESLTLMVRGSSANHFFPPFRVDADEIQLRLDWTDLDSSGRPSLDADFIDPDTGKHRKLQGERFSAHHTASLAGDSRSYEWVFSGFSRRFSILVTWRASIVEACQATDSCSSEVIRASDEKPKEC